MKEDKSKKEVDNEEEILEEEFHFNKSSQEDGINAFVQKNGKIIIISSVAVIVLIGLILIFRANSQKNEANAAQALARIEAHYFSGEYEIALNGSDDLPTVRGERVIGLVAIVNKYGKTAAGQRAILYAADAYYSLNNFSEARKFFERAARSKIDVVRIGGLAGVAACNEREGRFREAAENYIQAANLIREDALKLRYMYFAGLCFERAGNTDQARRIFRDIIDLGRPGEFNNLAKAGIVRLGEDVD